MKWIIYSSIPTRADGVYADATEVAVGIGEVVFYTALEALVVLGTEGCDIYKEDKEEYR